MNKKKISLNRDVAKKKQSNHHAKVQPKRKGKKIQSVHAGDIASRKEPVLTPLDSADFSESAGMFANRLRKKQKILGKWSKQEGITCYRLYDADMPEYSLALDLYLADKLYVVIQEYQAPKSVDEEKARFRLREALGVIRDVLELQEQQMFLKVRKRQKGTAQYEKLSARKQFYQVQENGLKFLVNFRDYLDTGIFLDHRITREMVRQNAKGKRFLNLFSYTGSATVYAASGGAASTVTVDMSNTYLDWARQNMELNGFDQKQYSYIQADCLKWLKEESGKLPHSIKRYDLIFLDPPSFSTSKRMQNTFDVLRDHVVLLRQTMSLLDNEGMLIFSNNRRKFQMDYESLSEFDIKDITKKTIPKDYEGNPRIHQCFILSHKQ